MKKRWAFFLSFMLAASALGFECWIGQESMDAKKQLTQDFLRNFDPITGSVKAHCEAENPSARKALDRSETLSWLTVPIAAVSGLCLFLSRRRKEPTAWRWTVAALLFLYLYLCLGPI